MFDLGNVGQALSITGSKYKLPEDFSGTAPAPPSTGMSMPMDTNAALAASGSSYRMPEPASKKPDSTPAWLGQAKDASDLANSVPSQSDGTEEKKSTDGILGKVVGLVAKVFSFL